MAYYINPLSSGDVKAVNEWHWPILQNGSIDPYAKIECTTDEMKMYRYDVLERRFKHAFNTFRKNYGYGVISKPMCWIIHTIAQIAEFDDRVIPEEIHTVIPDCIRYHNITEVNEESAALRDKILKILDIYASSIRPGRKKNANK